MAKAAKPRPKPINIPAGILLKAKPIPKPKNNPAGINKAPLPCLDFSNFNFCVVFLGLIPIA